MMKNLLTKNNWLVYFILSIIIGLILAFLLRWQSQEFCKRTMYPDYYESFWEFSGSLSIAFFLIYLNFFFYFFKNIYLKIIQYLWGLFSLTVALFMLFAAWNHNSQHEFHFDGSPINWEGITAIFLSWFIFLLLIQLIITLLIKGAYKLYKIKK